MQTILYNTMGIETVATPLDWFASLPHLEKVKMGGMRQFLFRFQDDQRNGSDYPDNALYFGDELEFMIIRFSEKSNDPVVDVDLCAHKVLAHLRQEQPNYIWATEYADYMVEAIAGKPWHEEDQDFLLTGINTIQESMHERRWKIYHQLQKVVAADDSSSSKCPQQLHHTVVSLSCFPALGASPRVIDNHEWQRILDTNEERNRVMTPGQDLEKLPVSRSFFLSDAVTSPHVRYQTLTRNMRLRKGAKMCSLLPVEGASEQDVMAEIAGGATKQPQTQTYTDAVYQSAFHMKGLHQKHLTAEEAESSDVQKHCLLEPFWSAVYTDCQAFGAGCCALQATFGCTNLAEASYLHDHFVVIAPLLLALSAASPCVKGTLTAFDTRWDLMSQTWDDRRAGENFSSSSESTLNGTAETTVESSSCSSTYSNDSEDIEITEVPSDVESNKVGFGRFYSPRHYISDGIDMQTLHDVPSTVHAKGYELLRRSGVPENLARHVSSLFVRDPLVVFKERIDLDETRDLDHWNSLNSTNWTTVRLKVPESEKNLPWRVEMRSPEIQMTDFENAALVTLLHTLVNYLLRRRRATTTDYSMGQHKNTLLLPISLVDENMRRSAQKDAITSQKFWWCGGERNQYLEKSLNEIFFDKESGLLELAYRDLLQHKGERNIPERNMTRLEQHIELYRRRCRGELQTTAQFIRSYLRKGADQNRKVHLTRVRELAHLAEQMGLHPSTRTVPPTLVSHDLIT
jgi:glutamate--cysteine ligase catalytic subunit